MTRPLPESTYREVVEALNFYQRHLTDQETRIAGFFPGTEDARKERTKDKLAAVRAALASLQAQPASGLSDFIRNATPERKAEVYGKVMERASAAQEATLQGLSPAQATLTDEYDELRDENELRLFEESARLMGWRTDRVPEVSGSAPQFTDSATFAAWWGWRASARRFRRGAAVINQVSHDYPACALFRGGKCTCD